MVLEVLDVGVAGNEPEQLVDNGLEVDLLGGEQGEALREVEAHLVAEDALRAHPGAVVLHHAVVHDFLQEVEVLLHYFLTPNAKMMASW